MIVLEKWIPNKPISAIYFDGEKEKHYVKRFLIENENREDVFISEHASSVLEIVSTDWRPVAKVSFVKERGKERREDQIIDLEQFINIKGVSALGNQLTKYKVHQIDLTEPLPFEQPKETPADEIDVVGEELITQTASSPEESNNEITSNSGAALNSEAPEQENDINDEGQITMF